MSATTGVDYVSPSDERLSDSRTPTSHTHPNTEVTGLGGAAVLGVGTSEGTVCAGNDSRLSDARTPVSHTHAPAQIEGSSTVGQGLIVAPTASEAAALLAPYNFLSGFPGIIKRKSYAVADLPAAATVGAGAEAYCTDCLTPNGTGGYVQSDGTKWRLFNGLEATTDFLTYARSGCAVGVKLNSPMDTNLLGETWGISVQYHDISPSIGSVGTGSFRTSTLLDTTKFAPCYMSCPTGANAGIAFVNHVSEHANNNPQDRYYKAIVRIPTLSDGTNPYFCAFGFEFASAGDVTALNTLPTYLVQFVYDQGGNYSGASSIGTGGTASTKWQIVLRRNSTWSTPFKTAVTADTNWRVLEIYIPKDRSKADFYIDGSLVLSHTSTTSLPQGADSHNLCPGVRTARNGTAGTGTVFSPQIDYYAAHMRRTTALVR